MLFPIKQLIDGRGTPLSVSKKTSVREALTLMVENDYSQLPVINEQGDLIGIISESSITNTYFHIGATLSLLDLTVDHCMVLAKTISPESDIFEALNLLENVYAVVVVENLKPKGILTDYDTTHFFRDLSEGLVIVEDIEVTLRQYIEAVFPNERSMDAALMRAFKENKKDPSRPAKEYQELSFGEHIQLIITEHNWEKFEPYFAPKELFKKLMDQVGSIRNQLAHFRGKIESIQLNVLVKARDWLSVRPRPETSDKAIIGKLDVKLEDITLISSGTVKGKYGQLQVWLARQREAGETRVRLGFAQMEDLIGEKLPESAYKHRSWWENDAATHSQAESWLAAGWIVDDVELATGEMTFRQTNLALYYTFFTDLLNRLKSFRPGITQTQKASLQNWLSFSAGTTGYTFGWVLPKEHILRVELYIDRGEKSVNQAAFEALAKQKEEIETAIGQKLTWSPLPEARATRIFASTPFHVTQGSEEHERAKKWGTEMMLKFIDVLQPRLRGL